MEPYKNLMAETVDDLAKVVRDIVRTRDKDIADYNNLPNRFISGRSVGRAVPVDSFDVLATDRVGDVLHDHQYVYYLIDNAGSIEWRRINLHSF